MIKDHLTKHPKAIWIHFYKDRMCLMQNDGTVKSIEIPQIPYNHPRMILADFESATTTLKALMKHHSNSLSFFKFTMDHWHSFARTRSGLELRKVVLG